MYPVEFQITSSFYKWVPSLSVLVTRMTTDTHDCVKLHSHAAVVMHADVGSNI